MSLEYLLKQKIESKKKLPEKSVLIPINFIQPEKNEIKEKHANPFNCPPIYLPSN